MGLPRISISNREKPEVGPGDLEVDRENKTVQITCLSDLGEIKTRVDQALDQGKLVAWLTNTVESARERFDYLSKNRKKENLVLLHSRFALGDRHQIEEKIHTWAGPSSEQSVRSGRCVLGTQVLEQSLDVDFDLMVTELAPVDRIIQRVGRLHRHDRDNRSFGPELIVHSPPETDAPQSDWYEDTFEKAQYIYTATHRLWLTAQKLWSNDSLSFPKETPTLIDTVDQRARAEEFPECFEEAAIKFEGDAMANRGIAASNSLNQSQLRKGYDSLSPSDYSYFPTRLGPESRRFRLIDPDQDKWFHPKGRAWAAGDLRIREGMIAQPDYSKSDRERVNQLTREMDDCYTVEKDPTGWGTSISLLLLDEDYSTTAFQLNQDGDRERVTVAYSRTKGLSVS